MLQLVQNRSAALDVILRDDASHALRAGLGAGDLLCHLKRAGATTWTPKPLSPASWQEAGSGAYLLSLDPGEVDTLGSLLVLLTSIPGAGSPIAPALSQLEVVPAHDLAAARPSLPQTVVIGQLAGLDNRPIARATVTATLLQAPLLQDGVAVAGDAVITSSDDAGFFVIPLITGATVDLEIAAARYRRTLVVPAPPAPGVPVRLFAIP